MGIKGGNILDKGNRNRQAGELKLDQFPCFCCGFCCKNYQPWINVEEADSIAGKLGVSREKLITDYTDPRWPGTQSFLIRHVDGACIFLKYYPDQNKHLCRIHEFKPSSCRAWAAGWHQRECQQGLKNWDLQVDMSGMITGTPENIAKFTEFIRTCDV